MRSIRQRLIAVALLAAIACAGALSAVFELVRTGREQRVERAREAVVRRLAQFDEDAAIAPMPEGPQRGRHTPRGGMRERRVPAGRLDDSLRPIAGDPPPGPRAMQVLEQLAPRARATDEPVVESFDQPEGTAVVGLVALDAGGYAWAATRVITPPAVHAWRIGVGVLALASLALVIASLHTLFAFQRGARALQQTVSTIARDLTVPVPRPGLAELDHVADGIATMARDLSASESERERLRAELADRERLASLGRVAAGVAHEVRNPLASIKLRADLARRASDTPPGIATDLEEISSEVARLDRLVADLLVVAGRKKGPRVDTDVGVLCRKRVALMAPWADEHGVSVQVDGDGRAVIDADGVARAVDNLVRNAIEASPRGTEVRVSVLDDRSDGHVTVRVCDAGPGVPAERTGELFEPFFTTKSDGTGLGLALSRTVAVAHGGTLTYRRDGAQTCFALRLPRGQSPEASS